MNKITFNTTLVLSGYRYRFLNNDPALCLNSVRQFYVHSPERLSVTVANYYFPHSKRFSIKCARDAFFYWNDKTQYWDAIYTPAGRFIDSKLNFAYSREPINIWIKLSKLKY